jgi:hypothetical protein
MPNGDAALPPLSACDRPFNQLPRTATSHAAGSPPQKSKLRMPPNGSLALVNFSAPEPPVQPSRVLFSHRFAPLAYANATRSERPACAPLILPSHHPAPAQCGRLFRRSATLGGDQAFRRALAPAKLNDKGQRFHDCQRCQVDSSAAVARQAGSPFSRYA